MSLAAAKSTLQRDFTQWKSSPNTESLTPPTEGRGSSYSYTSECPFSEPRTLSCPRISPSSIAWLRRPEEGGERRRQLCESYNTRPLEKYLPNTLTLFTLPRYSSPSLQRANTSSPSLTPPILRRDTERGEQGLCENGNPIYPLNTLLPLLTYRVYVPPASQTAGFQSKGVKISSKHTHAHPNTHTPLLQTWA